MAPVQSEAFTIFETGEPTALSHPGLHCLQVVIHVVMFLEPFALAFVAGKHFRLSVDILAHVNHELRRHQVSLPVAPFIRIHEVKVRNLGYRGRSAPSLVIRRGRGEAGIAHKHTGSFVIGVIVDRRRRENNSWPSLPQQFGDAAARGIVVEDGEVAELQAVVGGADEGRRGSGFAAADGGDLFGWIVSRAAVTRSHGDDRHVMAAVDQVRERAGCHYFNIIGVCVNRQDSVGGH